MLVYDVWAPRSFAVCPDLGRTANRLFAMCQMENTLHKSTILCSFECNYKFLWTQNPNFPFSLLIKSYTEHQNIKIIFTITLLYFLVVSQLQISSIQNL